MSSALNDPLSQLTFGKDQMGQHGFRGLDGFPVPNGVKNV